MGTENRVEDVDRPVRHSKPNNGSSVGLKFDTPKANINENQTEQQGGAIKSTASPTGEGLTPAQSRNADGNEPMDSLKTSSRSIEDMWTVLNEVKSSIDQILLGMSNVTRQVKTGPPSSRDPTVMPLIASKLDGVKVTLWAKMDTGADKNFISPALVSRLGRDSEVKKDDGGVIYEIDGKKFAITCSVDIKFLAGWSNEPFTETFYVINAKAEVERTDTVASLNIPNETAASGALHIPDILLGGPFLKHSHALVTDPEFENPANPEYEVLADPPEAGATSCYAGFGSAPRSRALVNHPAAVRGPKRPIR